MTYFINEELSIHNDLEDSVNNVCNEIINKFNSIETSRYSRTGVTLSNGTQSLVSSCAFNVSFKFKGKDFNSLIKVYIFQDKQTLNEFYERFGIGSEYDQGHSFFRFNLFSIKGKGLDRQFMFNNIYHEVEHSLQYMMNGNKTSVNAYNLALELMNGTVPNNIKGDARYALESDLNASFSFAAIYYYYYPLELDANINGLYGELLENGLNIEKTNYWVNKKRIQFLLKELYINSNNNNLNIISKIFGFRNIVQFGKYVKKQQSYLKRKEMKVMQRAKNRLDLNESITFTSWHSMPPFI